LPTDLSPICDTQLTYSNTYHLGGGTPNPHTPRDYRTYPDGCAFAITNSTAIAHPTDFPLNLSDFATTAIEQPFVTVHT
jgi:hypothetical protein